MHEPVGSVLARAAMWKSCYEFLGKRYNDGVLIPCTEEYCTIKQGSLWSNKCTESQVKTSTSVAKGVSIYLESIDQLLLSDSLLQF